MLLTAPSLRRDYLASDNPFSFDELSKALRWRGPYFNREKDSMLVLLGYFVIAVGAGVAASGIIGYILASMLIRRYEKADVR